MNRSPDRHFGIMLMIFSMVSIPAVLGADIRIPADYPSFSRAVEAAVDGDSIIAADGVYTGPENTGIFIFKTLQIRSENGPYNCILDSSDAAVFFVQGDVLLKGLTIRGCRTSEYYAAYGGAVEGDANLDIDGCIFIDNRLSAYGDDNASARGGAVYGAGRITNCVFFDNVASGENWSDGGGVNGAQEIINCTFFDNYADVGSAVGQTSSVINCIVWQCEAPFSYVDDVMYSNVEGGYPGIGNFDEDPGFVWLEPFDFHLLDSSSCIDAGTDAGVYTDLDGEERPFGSHVDVGADEYTGAWPTPTPIPTVTPTPTRTPTVTPTSAPTATPTMQPGIAVDLYLSNDMFTAGEHFLLTATIRNSGPVFYHDLPFVVLLDVYGERFWYPAWTRDFSYEPVDVLVGTSETGILDFIWPETPSSGSGIMIYAALLGQDFATIVGDWDQVSFGWE